MATAAAAKCFVEREPVEAEGFQLVAKQTCPRCQHKESRHCPGGEAHTWVKGGAHGVSVCSGRHCMEPMCSCCGEAN